jgi:Family of unknown function (DUF5994)
MAMSKTSVPGPPRQLLRLRMSEQPGSQPLDGGWWPQSRELTVELRDLVDHFPAELGRIVRVLFSAPDWDDAPKRVPTARGYVQAGFDAHDDTHVVVLTTSDRQELCVLVVPPSMSRAKGDEALLASVTPGYASSPGALLTTVREHPDVDEGDRWNDEGESWWGSATAPSYRPAP